MTLYVLLKYLPLSLPWQVCDKTTGHAEVVQLTYDPAIVAYEDLLKVCACVTV